jgi:hypothetical protein
LSNLTISVIRAARVSGRLAHFDTPDVIGVERERAKGSGSRFANNSLETLCSQDEFLRPILSGNTVSRELVI